MKNKLPARNATHKRCRRMNLYPSVLTDSIQTLQGQLDLVKDNSNIKVVQIDIVDGQFANNLTITPLDLLDADFGDLKIDLHLMVEEPMDFVYEAVSIKKELPIRAIISQVERMSYFEDYLEEVKKHEWQVGLSLDLHTPVEEIKPFLKKLNVLQLMTVEAGEQGQEFQSQALKKIQTLNTKFQTNDKLQNSNNKKGFELIVDGGVKLENIDQLRKTGVDSICVGSALWQAKDINKAIQELI